MFKGLDHLAIVVPDTEEALKIWRDRLGFPVLLSEAVNNNTTLLTHLDLGNTHLQLVQPIAGEPTQRPQRRLHGDAGRQQDGRGVRATVEVGDRRAPQAAAESSARACKTRCGPASRKCTRPSMITPLNCRFECFECERGRRPRERSDACTARPRTMTYTVAFIVALGLFGYLIVALLEPERFS